MWKDTDHFKNKGGKSSETLKFSTHASVLIFFPMDSFDSSIILDDVIYYRLSAICGVLPAEDRN